MEQFKNLKDVITYFQDQKVCREYLEQMRWNGKPMCPHCKHYRPYKLKDGKTYRCSSKTCRKDFTVLVGSVMENTKIPLSTWMAAIYLGTAHKKGISSHQLARDLGVTQKTAWFLMHRVREMVKPHTDVKLDDTVQIDETYVKGEAKNRTQKKRKLIAEGYIKDEAAIVIGIVQNKGKGVLQVVPTAERESINKVIDHVVKDKETLIVTDAFSSYSGLELTYKGRIIVNHSQGEYINAGYHTNAVEGYFSLLKRAIFGTYHFVTAAHLQRYCDLLTYRYNSRKIKDGERFTHATSHIEGRLKWKNLIQKS